MKLPLLSEKEPSSTQMCVGVRYFKRNKKKYRGGAKTKKKQRSNFSSSVSLQDVGGAGGGLQNIRHINCPVCQKQKNNTKKT